MENRVEIHKFLSFSYVFFHRTFPHRASAKLHLFNEKSHKMGSVSNSVLSIKRQRILHHCLVVNRCFTFLPLVGEWEYEKIKICNNIYYCLICYSVPFSEVSSGIIISKLFSLFFTSWILSIFSSFNIFSMISRPI